MTLSISTVTNSIAALSVSGVTLKDIDEIPESVNARDCPILYPEPVDFLSNVVVTPMTTGTAGSGYFDVEYDLSYTYLHAPVGTGRGLLDHYKDMVDKVCLIIDRIIISDTITGAVDLSFNGAPRFVSMPDPAGNIFHGCNLVFRVKEFE